MDRFFNMDNKFFHLHEQGGRSYHSESALHCLLHSGGDHWTFHCRHVLRHFENGS